jgi:hypothetical protein
MRLPGVISLIAIAMTISMPGEPVPAHPGGLNAEDCHTNHKTGEYHCHRGGARTVAPVFSGKSRSASYPNCAAARAAGAAPISRGQPGYGVHLDRDGDGIACEPYRGR